MIVRQFSYLIIILMMSSLSYIAWADDPYAPMPEVSNPDLDDSEIDDPEEDFPGNDESETSQPEANWPSGNAGVEQNIKQQQGKQ